MPFMSSVLNTLLIFEGFIVLNCPYCSKKGKPLSLNCPYMSIVFAIQSVPELISDVEFELQTNG